MCSTQNIELVEDYLLLEPRQWQGNSQDAKVRDVRRHGSQLENSWKCTLN